MLIRCRTTPVSLHHRRPMPGRAMRATILKISISWRGAGVLSRYAVEHGRGGIFRCATDHAAKRADVRLSRCAVVDGCTVGIGTRRCAWPQAGCGGHRCLVAQAPLIQHPSSRCGARLRCAFGSDRRCRRGSLDASYGVLSNPAHVCRSTPTHRRIAASRHRGAGLQETGRRDGVSTPTHSGVRRGYPASSRRREGCRQRPA